MSGALKVFWTYLCYRMDFQDSESTKKFSQMSIQGNRQA
jgi:hypothetical protein